MEILEWITAILLLAGIGGTGVMKLTSNATAVEAAVRLGYENLRIPIGGVEVLAAVGVTLAAAVTDLEWLGALAAAGIVALMLGAVSYHIRARDKFETIPSIVLIGVALLHLIALAGN